MDFNEKVALILGSSSGIGEAVAIKLWSLGANVVITGRDDKRIAEVVDKCQSRDSQRALGVRADLMVDKDCERLVAKTISNLNRIDILVNNVGGGQRLGKVFRAPAYLRSYDRSMKDRVNRIEFLTQLALPHLTTTKGNIVNIASVAYILPSPLPNSHRIPKCTMNIFAKRLALQLEPKGIRVNNVNLCVVKYPMLNEVTGDTNGSALTVNYCRERHRSGGSEQLENVAEMVATIAAGDVSGLVMVVEGSVVIAEELE